MFGLSTIWANRSGKHNKENADLFDTRDRHHLEIEQFKAVLESYQATKIEQRLAILEAFLSTEKHVSLEELGALVAQNDPGLGDNPLFLKETMEMFCQFGFANAMSFENKETLYEHLHLGDHHDHFICTRCGRIQEFSNPHLESLQMDIARKYQFHPLQHKMEIYGLCSKCMEKRVGALPLIYAANGERVRIVKILGGRELQARLHAMGITAGMCVEVINNNAIGQVLLAVDGVRLALNRGMAEKIQVAHSCHHK